jgi:uncharacterized tellurite resistance protein B-like protein
MLRALTELFENAFGGTAPAESADPRGHGVQLATALLLIEVARADYKEDLTEDSTLFALLKDYFDLPESEAKLLIEQARQEADHAASLQAFTRRLHEQLTAEEKSRVIEMLWIVALADSHLDKHEDHLIRKVAGLLYVPHRELIRIRNRVRGH